MKKYKEKKGVALHKKFKIGLKKMPLLFLGFGLVLYQMISHAETDKSSSEIQTFELQIPDVPETPAPEIPTQEIQESKKGSSSFLKSSLLSVKVDSGDSPDFVTLSLELQKPIIMENNRLKWLIQGGIGGTDSDKSDSYYYHYVIDTGLGYVFPFFTTIVSLKGGLIGVILPSREESDNTDVILPRVTLSLGWKISHDIHIVINSFYTILQVSPHFGVGNTGLSISFPIKRW